MQNTTVARTVQARPLTPLALDFLSRVPADGFSLRADNGPNWEHDTRTAPEKAAEWTAARLGDWSVVVAYEGEFGVSLGVVRRRYAAGYAGRTEDTFEVSPFPGGWDEVPLSRILSVRGSTEI